MIYSAHDDSVVNVLRFFGLDFDWIPFASTVTLELKYSRKCLEALLDDPEKCFGVSILFNGVPQRLDGCSGDIFTLNGCNYGEFTALVNRKWYHGPGAPDLDAACF